jgi:hypothetical protein
MNRFSIYLFLVLIFLGLSKSFSPSENKTPFIANKNTFPNFFHGAPISVLLQESFQTGLLIKTYFQKYRVIHAFLPAKTIIIRTSKEFWLANAENHNASLFRRSEREGKEEFLPLPPGSLYVGDPAYGHWQYSSKSKRKEWKFHHAYRHFPKIFGWGKFIPDKNFHGAIEMATSSKKPLLLENYIESTQKKNSSEKMEVKKPKLQYLQNQLQEKFNVLKHLKKFFNIPPWSARKV